MTSINSLIEYFASPKYSDQLLVSSDRSILSRRQVEIIPRESSTFGQQTASDVAFNGTLSQRTTFHLSDPRHYVDWRNTYFHANIKVNGADVNGADIGVFLDNGGIHSCIRSMVIRHGSAELLRIENYNKLYNATMLPSVPREQRDLQLGAALDSYEDQYESKGYPLGDFSAEAIAGNIPNAGTTYADATKILTINAGTLTQQVASGDVLKVTTAAGSWYGKVLVVTADTTLTIEGLPLAADGAVTAVVRVKQALAGQEKSMRRDVVSSAADASTLTEHKVSWQIPFNVFDLEQYFPLPFLTSSLEITLEWEYPHLAMVVPIGFGATDNKLGYAMTNLRLVAMMVEPSAEVFESHRRIWKDNGLVYKLTGIRSYENQYNSGSQINVSYQTNIKSLKAALSVLTDQTNANSTVNSAAGQEAYAQSAFNKKEMTSYRFRVGGLSFPDYGSVDVNQRGSWEAWRQLQLVMNQLNDKYGSQHGSIPAHKWRSTTSDKFIMAMQFAKEYDIYNAGVDVSNNYLEHEVVTVTLDSAQTMHTFLMYDMALVISEKSHVRLYY